MTQVLSEQDFADAAERLGCSIPAIKAVCEVEAPRGGFNPDNTLATLFEAHKFHRFTDGKYDESHPNLSSKKWNRALYGKSWRAERARLAEAAALDPVAAIMATSWGRFQIMGFNCAKVGFTDPADMVNAFATGERAQLMAFCAYVEATGLTHSLRENDWQVFALGYNGPAAEENQYPAKLAAAYKKHGGE